MLNLFYSESYWGHTDKMNGPKKVVCNLLESLDQENIPYAINEEKYKYNFILQYDYTGHEKHSNLHLEHCVIGPQVWMFDDHVSVLKENPHPLILVGLIIFLKTQNINQNSFCIMET